MRRLGWLLFGLVVVLALAWAAAALHFTGPRPALLADGLAAALVVAGLVVLFAVRPFGPHAHGSRGPLRRLRALVEQRHAAERS